MESCRNWPSTSRLVTAFTPASTSAVPQILPFCWESRWGSACSMIGPMATTSRSTSASRNLTARRYLQQRWHGFIRGLCHDRPRHDVLRSRADGVTVEEVYWRNPGYWANRVLAQYSTHITSRSRRSASTVWTAAQINMNRLHRRNH